jgi:hypothetical protein
MPSDVLRRDFEQLGDFGLGQSDRAIHYPQPDHVPPISSTVQDQLATGRDVAHATASRIFSAAFTRNSLEPRFVDFRAISLLFPSGV